MSFKSFSTAQAAPAQDKPVDKAKTKDAATKDGTAPKAVTAVNDTKAEPKP